MQRHVPRGDVERVYALGHQLIYAAFTLAGGIGAFIARSRRDDELTLVAGGLGALALLAVFVTERIKYPAPGLFGGGAGALGEVLIDGKPANTRMQQTLNKGTRIIVRTPGGGGYGKG